MQEINKSELWETGDLQLPLNQWKKTTIATDVRNRGLFALVTLTHIYS